jgi:uncharacterized protein YbaP (TraB family)
VPDAKRIARWLLPLLAALMLLPEVLGAPAPEEEAAPPPRRPILWVVERETPVYLFGTIHLPDPRLLDLPTVVRKAFVSADAFNAEIPMEPAEMVKAQPLMMLPADQSLDELLSKELHERVAKQMGALGVPATILDRFKVWVVGMQLFMRGLSQEDDEEPAGEEPAAPETPPTPSEGMRPPTPGQPMDMWLYNEAKRMEKGVGGLETMAEQLAVFDAMSIEDQVDLVEMAVDMLEGKTDAEEGDEGPSEAEQAKDQVKRLVAAYLAGDVEAIARLMKEVTGGKAAEGAQKFMRRLIDDRNVLLAEILIKRVEADPDKVWFFAVGTAHYPGEGGIIDRLQKKGWKIRRVEWNEEIPARREPAAVR